MEDFRKRLEKLKEQVLKSGEAMSDIEGMPTDSKEPRSQPKSQVTGWPSGRYKTILADPPWDFRELGYQGYEATGKKWGIHAGMFYDVMTAREISNLPVQDLAMDTSHLYLWTTHNFLKPAIEIIGKWGFEYKGLLVWIKKPGMGMGYYFRYCTEFLLFGVRGSLRTLVRDQRDYFEAQKKEHSRKPEESFRIIERCSPGPRIELFARNTRQGWDSWGLEVEQ